MQETQTSHFWLGHFPLEFAEESFGEVWDDEIWEWNAAFYGRLHAAEYLDL